MRPRIQALSISYEKLVPSASIIRRISDCQEALSGKIMAMLHVVLYRPQIPPNTGNIARQCVGMNAGLHIVKPVGFDLSRQAARRAGLDYWEDVRLSIYESREEFLMWLGDREPWVITSRGGIRYDRPEYGDEDLLLFGSETLGLPDEWLDRWSDRTVYVPMHGRIRNYNLANTVSVVLAQASLKAGMYDKWPSRR